MEGVQCLETSPHIPANTPETRCKTADQLRRRAYVDLSETYAHRSSCSVSAQHNVFRTALGEQFEIEMCTEVHVSFSILAGSKYTEN